MKKREKYFLMHSEFALPLILKNALWNGNFNKSTADAYVERKDQRSQKFM